MTTLNIFFYNEPLCLGYFSLQRAIIRFNVPERQISGGDQATEEIPVPVDTNKPISRLKLVQRRRRRKLSKFRKRIRGQRTLTSE